MSNFSLSYEKLRQVYRWNYKFYVGDCFCSRYENIADSRIESQKDFT